MLPVGILQTCAARGSDLCRKAVPAVRLLAFGDAWKKTQCRQILLHSPPIEWLPCEFCIGIAPAMSRESWWIPEKDAEDQIGAVGNAPSAKQLYQQRVKTQQAKNPKDQQVVRLRSIVRPWRHAQPLESGCCQRLLPGTSREGGCGRMQTDVFMFFVAQVTCRRGFKTKNIIIYNVIMYCTFQTPTSTRILWLPEDVLELTVHHTICCVYIYIV